MAWQQPIVGAFLSGSLLPSLGSLPLPCGGWVMHRTELVVPWTRRPHLDGAIITRTRRWTRGDMIRSGPVRLTSMGRTLLDLAPRLCDEDLERALDAAHRRGLDLRRYRDYLNRAAARKVTGASRLGLLVDLRDPDRPIETEAETLVFHVLRRGGLPLPVPQYWVQTRSGPKRLDFAYPDQLVAIEFDSYEWHGNRSAFDKDKARDNELADLGWDRRHITWTMLTEDPAEVQWTVGRALALEPRTWRPAPAR